MSTLVVIISIGSIITTMVRKSPYNYKDGDSSAWTWTASTNGSTAELHEAPAAVLGAARALRAGCLRSRTSAQKRKEAPRGSLFNPSRTYSPWSI